MCFDSLLAVNKKPRPMKKIILFSFVLVSVNLFAQDDRQSKIKSELVAWDPVRGEWLAESFNAMANNKPIPDRTFPEDLTPAEMYSLVPADRQGRIREISNQSTNNRVPEPSQTTENRVPVGTSSTNNRIPNANDRYNYYVSRPGCGLIMGRSYGDPHIRTYDGKSYSFQTVGEYVLSSSPDRLFEVQARQKPQTNDVSLNTAIAMNVYGDRVGIYASDVPDGNHGTPVRVNGRPVYVSNETFYLPHGGTIQHIGGEYVVTWPTGEKVQSKLSSTGGMRFMNVSVFVYKCNGNYFGLLGNANGRSDDDFYGSRNDFASSSIFSPFDRRDFGRATSSIERDHLAFLARDFGNQFLVNDQTSLFDYGFGQSSWTFYDPSFPRNFITMGDISQADRDRARRECERQGILSDDMNGCVMDLAHSNIQPTPRPTTNDRTSGREITPVSERKPNVNRPDIFEREPAPRPSGGKVVIGETGERKPSTSGDRPVIGSETIKDENQRENVTPGTRNPGGQVGTPNKEGKIEGQGSTVRPSSTSGTPVRKPVENTESTGKKPTVQPSTDRPSSTDTRKPSQTNVDKPVVRPATDTKKPEEKPVVRPVTEPKKPAQTGRPATPSSTQGKSGGSSTQPSTTKTGTVNKTSTPSGSRSTPTKGR